MANVVTAIIDSVPLEPRSRFIRSSWALILTWFVSGESECSIELISETTPLSIVQVEGIVSIFVRYSAPETVVTMNASGLTRMCTSLPPR